MIWGEGVHLSYQNSGLGQRFRIRAKDLGLTVLRLGFRIQGRGFRGWGSGFRVLGVPCIVICFQTTLREFFARQIFMHVNFGSKPEILDSGSQIVS